MRAILLSAVAPGTGHRLLGESRWLAYMAVDLAGWAALSESRNRGHALQDTYRTLAWAVARGRVEPRVDGDFGYYEKLMQYDASGAFDRDRNRPGIQPETDPTTLNGSIWRLATELYFPRGEPPPGEDDPAYLRALEYYRRRAVPEELLWDWRSNGPARAVYGGLVRDSDEVLRRSVAAVGLLLANRVLSVVDLYVLSRGGGEAPVQVRLLPDPAGDAVHIVVRVPTGP